MKDLISSGKIEGEFYNLTTVPVRICDIGGWLDTWFAVNGEVLNISVLSRYAGIEAPFRGIDILTNISDGSGIVRIIAADPSYDVTTNISELMSLIFDKENLLLATLSLLPLDEFKKNDITIRIESPIPPGASMGTSAAVSVGLISALNQFFSKKISGDAIAKLAFRAETEVMGGQSGTQDQWSAASGEGINIIKISSYPKTQLEKVQVSKETLNALEEGLITVFVGQHSSSEVHKKVISSLEKEGEHGHRLLGLRTLAQGAREALENGDLVSFGQIMTKNTEAQMDLHPGLVGKNHSGVIALAKTAGCLGYKVNGAGGEGGSVSILFKSSKDKSLFHLKAVKELNSEFKYFEHAIAARQ